MLSAGKPCRYMLLLLLIATGIASCKKQETEPAIKVEFKLLNLSYYPNDSISLRFLISAQGGQEPYTWHWINPSELQGEGPFTLWPENDLSLELEVSDALMAKKSFHILVLRDSIDPVTYDYRNPLTGTYDCYVHYRQTIDSAGNWITRDSFYKDTLTVAKHTDFDKLDLPEIQSGLIYYPQQDYFFNYHTSLRFKGDSIFVYTYNTPVALYAWEYSGIKL